MGERVIMNEDMEAFGRYPAAEEKAENTVGKYMRDVRAFVGFVGGAVTKEAVIAYKNHIAEQGYAKRSINGMLCSVNAFLHFCGRDDCRVKLLKLQREVFCREEKELTRAEFERLCGAALSAGNRRLYIVSSEHEHRREMERMKLIC